MNIEQWTTEKAIELKPEDKGYRQFLEEINKAKNKGDIMKKVLLVVVLVLLSVCIVGCGNKAAKKAKSNAGTTDKSKRGIPLYDGKPGTKIGDTCINPKDGAEMVWVPAGEFLMGSDKVNDKEKPQRKVYLDSYWMYKYEVTVAQYRKFCKATSRLMPKRPSWGWIDNHPIVNENWQDAADYAKWAGVKLPTEAQWEKAARGTDGREYPWGNNLDATKCVNPGNVSSTQPVGSLPAGVSPYGCMDMAGNVGEWCADWYDEDYYKSAPSRNPTSPSTGTYRVLRGGSWGEYFLNYYRCAYRSYLLPDACSYVAGFRLVR